MSGRWPDLLTQKQAPVLFEAVVASAPATLSAEMEVIIPSHSTDQVFDGCPWMPRVDSVGDVVMPLVGDRVLVAFGETGTSGEPELWAIAWWPFEEV